MVTTTDQKYWEGLKEWTHIINRRIGKIQEDLERHEMVDDLLESMVIRLSERVRELEYELEGK